MSSVPYAHITQGPAIIQSAGPAVVTRRRGLNPLIPLCCIGLILFLIASTIILALIPVYLNRNTVPSGLQSIPYNTVYRLNNAYFPLGGLSASNCARVQADQQRLSAARSGVSPSVPVVIACTITGNTTTGRRRRQASGQGNILSIDGLISGTTNCPRGPCLLRRAQNFIRFLLTRGDFTLVLIAPNGTEIVVSITVISATISPATTTTNNDLAVLNYALTLENLEANFYTKFQAQFAAQDFIAANFTQETYDYFNIIYTHELAHVRSLQAIITQLGGTPVPMCTYNFSLVTDVRSYVSVARVLENTGAMAYDGAVNGIASPTVRQAGATIATVEARHAAYLNSLNGIIPFPDTFENATAPSVIIQAITPFIISCPYTLTPPNVPYTGASGYTGTIPTSNDTSVQPYTSAMYLNDINALNFALIAENLESSFYIRYAANYSSSDYINNGYDDASMNFIVIREIEKAHAQFLTMTITQRGGTPVPLCTYTFNINSVVDFVNTSRLLENTGVSAYDGSIKTIRDPALIMGGATIATVEARFASYVNDLSGNVPFPNITDPAIEPADIVTILAPYQSCPFTPKLPVVL